ncbi:MAG: LPP20 family lipoprotein [Fidelibacterota bacterium]|nr:MAG: LPP20 family lipoprotein [Candidatus Neomarinimicrobiota bacterium]
MRCYKLIATIIVLASSVSIAQAQWATAPGTVAEANDFGLVDYSNREIKATGIGAVPPNAPNVGAARANAIRAARVDALRNLVEAVKAVRVTSETTVNNNMVENDIVRTKVEAMVRGAQQVGDVKYLSDASVEVAMSVPMSGIMDVVLPTTVTSPPPLSGEATGAPAAVPVESAPVTPVVAGQPITGLIIDTRGLGIKPSMSPRVLADDGSILYGPGKYPRDFAVTQGVVGYHKDIEAAKDDARVAGNPLTIRGTRTSGTLATDVVISMSAAQQAAGFDGFAEAIGNCRVMFILD